MEDKKTTKNVFACWSCKKPLTMRERAEADGNCPHCDVELDVEDWPCPVHAEPSARSQGEPVAKSQWDVSSNPVLGYADSYRAMARQGVETVSIWSVITDLERNIAPLYAEQPAPVAVVLPERMSVPRGDLQPFERAEAIKWNACIDEVTRLNTKEYHHGKP